MNEQKLAKNLRNKLDKEWKEKVRKEYKDVCAIGACMKVRYLNCHHILPKEIYKEFRHEPMNGILLCPRHHKFGRLSAHKNPLWFIWWLQTYEPDKYEHLLDLLRRTDYESKN